MKILTSFILGLTLTACSTTSPSVMYHPANEPHAIWFITGNAETEVKNEKIIININDERAITGLLNASKLRDRFIGSYQGHSLAAECEISPQGLVYNHICTVFADDNKPVAQLRF